MKRFPSRPSAPCNARRGLTLIEVLVVTVVLAIALNALTGAITNTMRLGPVNRENAVAMDAARDMVESLHNTEFEEVFARFNADAADDPVAGVSPGSGFDVPGLVAVDGDADGLVGEIEFPTVGSELREDAVDRELGLPRDLNQDGAFDTVDHAGDYEVLPFRVRLRWTAQDGTAREFELTSMVVRP